MPVASAVPSLLTMVFLDRIKNQKIIFLYLKTCVDLMKNLVPISGVSVVSSFVASHLKEKQFLKEQIQLYTLNLTNIKPKIIF